MPWEPMRGPGDEVTPLRRGLDRFMALLGSPPVDERRALEDRWVEVIGAALAPHARPGSLVGGTLTVVVATPAFVEEVRWATPTIRQGCADALGEGVVTDVDVVVARG